MEWTDRVLYIVRATEIEGTSGQLASVPDVFFNGARLAFGSQTM